MGQIPYISRQAAEEFLAKFNQAIHEHQEPTCVLHVCGIGGVGKSTLKEKVKEAHQATATIAEVSFGLTEGIEEPIPLMAKLYEQIAERDSWSGDPFWDKHELYYETIHRLETQAISGRGELSGEQLKWLKSLRQFSMDVSGLLLSEEKRKTVEKVSDSVLSGLSVLNDARQLLQQHKATKRNRELQELMLEPLPKLTQAFVKGLAKQAEQQPIILILDTYEKALSTIDTWLWRTLLSNTKLAEHRICIMIAGQHSILHEEGWRKLKQDRRCLYERPIQRFDARQTQQYLNQIGITDKTRIQNIYKVTKGLPRYLDWVREQHERGNQLDFSQGNQTIEKVLLGNLEEAPNRKQLVQSAACCRWFNRQVLQSVLEVQALEIDVQEAFAWLTQQSFVEFVQHQYRLDDVARDVFRLSLWQEDKQQFYVVHDALATYFAQEADAEVPPDSPPPALYDNPDWRRYTTEVIYHSLFTRREDAQLLFLTHLFAAVYLGQGIVVERALQAIIAEADLDKHPSLPHKNRIFLQQVAPAVEQSWWILQNASLDDEILNNSNLARSEVETALDICFSRLNELDGLARVAALIYKSQHCPDNERKNWLLIAQIAAEKVVTLADRQFSSDLFCYEIGNRLSEIGCFREAIVSYESAVKIKPNSHDAWYNRGNVWLD